jgi:hypothetical protein
MAKILPVKKRPKPGGGGIDWGPSRPSLKKSNIKKSPGPKHPS